MLLQYLKSCNMHPYRGEVYKKENYSAVGFVVEFTQDIAVKNINIGNLWVLLQFYSSAL